MQGPNDEIQEETVDVAIVGGGPAGLAAALILGRSCRKVLVIDGGKPRNAPSPALHAFPSRDGTPPGTMRALCRDELERYDGVRVTEDDVADATPEGGRFVVTLRRGGPIAARKVLLATGVRDVLPEVPGLRELWGRSALHCPFCHGWEVRGAPLAVYGNGAHAAEQARILTGWSRDIVLCTDGEAEMGADDWARLGRAGIAIREERVARFAGRDGVLDAVEFADGSRLPRRAVFLRPTPRYERELPERLGCALQESGAPVSNETGETSVPGVFVAGEADGRPAQVLGAAAGGARAAYALYRALAEEDLAAR